MIETFLQFVGMLAVLCAFIHAYPVASHAYLPLYLCNLSGCLPQPSMPY
jgi:hypothetical protein